MKTISYRLALALRAGADNARKTAEDIRREVSEGNEAPYRAGLEDALEWDKDARLIEEFLASFDQEVLP